MSNLLLAWLTAPVQITGFQRLLLLLPLCLSISIVYKTTRCARLSHLPAATLALWLTIVAGMLGVGVLMWAAFLLLA
ncbi:MAG: hypothetical protein GY842_28190 [bacterium]|nr:hypothetical protein [bacterium]